MMAGDLGSHSVTLSPLLSPRPLRIALKQIYRGREREQIVSRSLNSRSPFAKKTASPVPRQLIGGDIGLIISSFSSVVERGEVRKSLLETLQPIRILPMLRGPIRQPSYSESSAFSVVGIQTKPNGESPVRTRGVKGKKLAVTLRPIKGDQTNAMRKQLRKTDTSTRRSAFRTEASALNCKLRFLSTDAVRTFDGLTGWDDN